MVRFLLFGAGVAVGLGGAALAPGLMPQIARAARPTAKEALKTAFAGYAQLRVAVAETAEAVSDLLAEVEHEMTRPSPAEPTAPPPAAAAAAAAAARAAALAGQMPPAPRAEPTEPGASHG
jgi:hypothetical protein